MRKTKRLLDEYRHPGCRPRAKLKGKFGDRQARVIVLERRQKNGMRLLRDGASEFLRSRDQAYTRLAVRWAADISGGWDQEGELPCLWESEDRGTEMVGWDGTAYAAIDDRGGVAVPRSDDAGGLEEVASGLAYGEGA